MSKYFIIVRIKYKIKISRSNISFNSIIFIYYRRFIFRILISIIRIVRIIRCYRRRCRR